jgi:2-oxo-4-hydroxy-4-carboxy--5-ureidoimidazoline (OHCU) decarboxylase
MLPTLDELNRLGGDGFRDAVRPLFEGAARFTDRLERARPFASYEDLLEKALDIALRMPEAEQLELIDSHPRIGAAPSTVSGLSHREQGYDRAPPGVDAELQAALEALNEAYEERFGFRFVIFVAGRPRSAIVPIIEQRLGASREEEKRRALGDVITVARDRLQRLGMAGEGA